VFAPQVPTEMSKAKSQVEVEGLTDEVGRCVALNQGTSARRTLKLIPVIHRPRLEYNHLTKLRLLFSIVW
jgi:hypothetical protein